MGMGSVGLMVIQVVRLWWSLFGKAQRQDRS